MCSQPRNTLQPLYLQYINGCCALTNTPVYLVLSAGANRCDPINFIKENNRWTHLVCLQNKQQNFLLYHMRLKASPSKLSKLNVYLVKQEAELSFRLAHPFAEAVRPFPHKERHLPLTLTALVCQGSSNQSLSCPRRAIEQTAPGTHSKHS